MKKLVKVSSSPNTWIESNINIPDEVIIQRYRDRINLSFREEPEISTKRSYKKLFLRKTT